MGCKWAHLICHHRNPKRRRKEKKSNFLKTIVSMWRWSASSTFFLGVSMSHLIYPSQEKKKNTYSNLWMLSKKKFLLEDQVLSLWPKYIGERRTTLSKAYGIKAWWCWAYLGEHNNKQFPFSSFLLVWFSVFFCCCCCNAKNCHKRKHDDDVHDYKQPMN